MNTREIGNKLENWLIEYLKELDPKTRKTNNSGAVSNNGDLMNKYFQIEAKHRNTKNLTINMRIWNKLCNQIPIGSLKTPLLVLRNENNETFAVLNFKDFMRILKNDK